MNKSLRTVLYYALFGALATGISTMLLAPVFAAGVPAFAVYGVTMALSMWLSNEAELKAWAHPALAARSDNMAVRLLVRLGIYMLIPAVLLYAIGFTGILAMPRGFLTALALTWMPLWLGAMLNYFPARKR
jgi:hypothetical protein